MTTSNVNAVTETPEQELARLRAENEALKQAKVAPITLKVSQKGAISVYGLGRFPVTLYANQFERLLDKAGDIRNFIMENAANLSVKD